MSSQPARTPRNHSAVATHAAGAHPAPFPRRCPYGCGHTVVEKYEQPRTKYVCTECEKEVQYVDF